MTIMNLFLEIISQNGIEDIRSKFVEQNVYNIYYIIELQWQLHYLTVSGINIYKMMMMMDCVSNIKYLYQNFSE